MATSDLRYLPPVGALLEDPAVAPLLAGPARTWVTRLVQEVVDDRRRELLADRGGGAVSRERLHAELVERIVAEHAALLAPAMRRVVNATGIIVHTNLGRSRYPEQAVAWATLAARHPVDLEIDLVANRRGHRGRGVERKLALLTGAEDALVVNNNAAAVWLALRVAAAAGRVVLSRGEVVAIGGSFRMHEIVAETGCELVEVGTTNRTTLDDYLAALVPGAVVLKVHRSNFSLRGFTEEVALADLAEACHSRGHLLVYDAGSGLLADLAGAAGLDQRPLAAELAAGPDLVTCSGDKLFGGCQAGIVLGRRDLVARLREHPMRRAFRVDKTTLAALDGTVTHYLAGEQLDAVPTLAAIVRPLAELEELGRGLLEELAADQPAGWRGELVEGVAQVGGGCSAEAELPSRLLQWQGPREDLETVHRLLRTGDPAVLARIGQQGLAVDLRSLAPEDPPVLVQALRRAWRQLGQREEAGNG